jgi:hypothetical protein
MRTLGAALRKFLGVGLTVCVVALAACSDALPPPRVVDEAPQLARVAELLKMPPLRPVPAAMVELTPPYACGKHAFLSMQFAYEAGVVLVAGVENYAVMDISNGEVVARGAGRPGASISPNGRVLAVPVQGAVELRIAESGEVIVRLEGATSDEFIWVGDGGMLHIAPGIGRNHDPRVVYRDLETGLESSLVTVPVRDDSEIHTFGAVPIDEQGGFVLEVRRNLYEMSLTQGPAGVAASVGRPRTVDFNPSLPFLIIDRRFLTFEDEGLIFHQLPTLASHRVPLPGYFPRYAIRTGDPDIILVRGHFKDEAQMTLNEDGEVAWRDFYYSVSRNRLAPVETGADLSHMTYIRSLRSHLIHDERTLRPFTLPPGGEEGDIATVLAAAKGAILDGGAIRQAGPAR